MTPEPPEYATALTDGIKACFEHFLTESIETMVVNMSNLEEKVTSKDSWKEVTQTDIRANMDLLTLTGHFRSTDESTSSFWDQFSGLFLLSGSNTADRLVNTGTLLFLLVVLR